MTVLIDGEAVREDINSDDLERIAIAGLLGRTSDAVRCIADDLVETAQEWAPRDSEFEIDLNSIYSEITGAFREWICALSEDEKTEIAVISWTVEEVMKAIAEIEEAA